VDEESDSEKVVEKKIRSLTRKILPAGADNLAVLMVQNLVHARSIFSRLVEGTADFLRDRIASGPIPAVENLEIEDRDSRPMITGGRATWRGMPLNRLQEILDDEGLAAFMSERMHRTRDPAAEVFEREWWTGRNRYRIDDPLRTVVGRWMSLDLSMKDKETSAYNALVVFELTSEYLLDVRYVWREKLSFPRLMPRLEPMAWRWNHDGKLQGFIVEDKAHGVTVLQTIEEGSDEWLKGVFVPFDPGSMPKEQRWQQAASWGPTGGIRLPYPHPDVPQLHEFEEEVYGLPNSSYKDFADSFSQGVIYLEHYIAEGLRARRAYGGVA
jgi:phage terminase large subunit-like protein